MKTNTKEWIQYSSAVAMLALGGGLSIASFARSGEVHDSVLWLFAQCLMYAGSVFGISVFIADRFRRLETKVMNELNNKEGKKDEVLHNQ